MRKSTSRIALYVFCIVFMFTAAFIAGSVEDATGIPSVAVIILALALLVIPIIMYERSPRRVLDWVRTSPQLTAGLPPEKLAAHEAALRERWEAGERSLELMVALSHMYLQLKRPQEAERFAEQACAQEEASGLKDHTDWQRREVRDNAFLARANVRALRGEFAEAARELDEYRRVHAYLQNHLTVYTALLYLLAGDEEMARTVTADIKPGKAQNARFHLRPAYQFLAAYLQQRFLGKDTSATLEKQSWQLGAWLQTYHVHADFEVYHARMREIVADMAETTSVGWLQFANLRWSMNETEAMITEMEARRAQGDTSYQTALLLASSQGRLGHGEQAEPIARAAFDAIQAEGWFERRDNNARYVTDAAYDALACALLMQGRFGEAADCLMQVAPRALYRNLFLVLSAWNYYLAGDEEKSRAVIHQMKPVRPSMKRGLSPGFVLLLHYLRYRLGMDASPQAVIDQAPDALEDWQKPLDRLTDNPYRRAVQAMVEDVQALAAGGSQAATPTV